jgi:hypothetical protein
VISTTIPYPRIAMHACQDIVLCARSDPPAAFEMSRIRHLSGAGFPECSIDKREQETRIEWLQLISTQSDLPTAIKHAKNNGLCVIGIWPIVQIETA